MLPWWLLGWRPSSGWSRWLGPPSCLAAPGKLEERPLPSSWTCFLAATSKVDPWKQKFFSYFAPLWVYWGLCLQAAQLELFLFYLSDPVTEQFRIGRFPEVTNHQRRKNSSASSDINTTTTAGSSWRAGHFKHVKRYLQIKTAANLLMEPLAWSYSSLYSIC